MGEEQQKQPATVSREDLYRQVWATPMLRLGEQYGISGNGLKKICDRLQVPYPPLGYWAKLRAGKSVTAASLPDPQSDTPMQVTITPTPPPSAARVPALDPEMAENLRAASTKASEITVPATLHRPHWAIAAWITKHEREIAAAKRDRPIWGTASGPKPFTPLERRRQRFLNTLFKEVERLGYKIKGEAPYGVSLETGQNKIEFTLRERIRQIRRPLTDEEKAKSYYANQEWQQERVATDELIFTLKTYLGPGVTLEWRDGERRLEDRIGDIIAVLAIAGPILERQRQAAVEAERRHWEEEKRRNEERRRRDQDRNRWRRLVELAKLWQEARLAGDFLDALEKHSPAQPEATYDGRSAAEWMAWARERRDAFDPSKWSSDDLCTNLASVTAWEYRDRH